jgi:hypothetical protein
MFQAQPADSTDTWQSRAREAEEVLYQYDVRMEEAVLRALTLLDASRHKQALCHQHLEQVKLAVLEEEERTRRQKEEEEAEAAMKADLAQSLVDDALQGAVTRGIEIPLDSEHSSNQFNQFEVSVTPNPKRQTQNPETRIPKP